MSNSDKKLLGFFISIIRNEKKHDTKECIFGDKIDADVFLCNFRTPKSVF